MIFYNIIIDIRLWPYDKYSFVSNKIWIKCLVIISIYYSIIYITVQIQDIRRLNVDAILILASTYIEVLFIYVGISV